MVSTRFVWPTDPAMRLLEDQWNIVLENAIMLGNRSDRSCAVAPLIEGRALAANPLVLQTHVYQLTSNPAVYLHGQSQNVSQAENFTGSSGVVVFKDSF
jgi:hypothetical protein